MMLKFTNPELEWLISALDCKIEKERGYFSGLEIRANSPLPNLISLDIENMVALKMKLQAEKEKNQKGWTT